MPGGGRGEKKMVYCQPPRSFPQTYDKDSHTFVTRSQKKILADCLLKILKIQNRRLFSTQGMCIFKQENVNKSL